MASADDTASFTFSWRALKLLGRGLYSNPWSALSELVANGLDAGASEVYVYVDARNKSNAVVEVIDNGCGMSRADIDTYVKVGHDKRKAAMLSEHADARPKGRKGIGKLAALFLSPHFFLSTRHAEGSSSWELDAREDRVDDDENPTLVSVVDTDWTPNDDVWSGLATGTRLTMLGVDLTGYGPQAIGALGTRLANQFLLPVSSTPRILLWVHTRDDEVEPEYAPVEKNVAYNNLAAAIVNFPDDSVRPAELSDELPTMTLPVRGLPGGNYLHTQERLPMKVRPDEDKAWPEIKDVVDLPGMTYNGVKFVMAGWLGVHATIENAAAQENDPRFTKNRFYNPAQIRVYVRGKLASDRLLSQLGLTGTFANYIEGEISFDLLDEDTLPDIATSNRQDFDETDKRVTLLRAIVRPLARSLIQSRVNLAGRISDEVDEEKLRRETASKRQFSAQVRADLDSHEEISLATRDELELVITNKIQGDVLPKQSFRVFISHASADRPFVAFIDELLRARGARIDEIFFTSRTGTTEVLQDDRALGEVVKRNIIDDNCLVFYMTSKNFMSSQYCLFEGGAGWATRSVSEYLKLNVDFRSIPAWLTNGRGEALLLDSSNNIELRPDIYNYLVVGVLNPMIQHMNRGRDIAGADLIPLFDSVEFPSAVDMRRAGKAPRDYFDPLIVEHWEVVVDSGLAAYLDRYLSPSPGEARIAELEEENMDLRTRLAILERSADGPQSGPSGV